MFEEKTVEEIGKMSMEEQVKYFNDLNAHKAKQLEDFKTKLKEDNSETLKASIKTLKEEIVADNVKQLSVLQDAMEKIGLTVGKLANQGSPNTPKNFISILKEKETELKSLADGQNKSLKFTVDKTTVLTTAVEDSTLAYRESHMGVIQRAKDVIRQLFPSVPVGAGMGGTVRWVEWALDTNGAAYQTEGSAKAEGAMSWIEKSMPIQTVAEWIKVSKQALTDFGYIAGQIRTKLVRDLTSKIDTTLFSGTGSSPEIKGIYTWATEYVATPAGITDASIYDLIVKMHESISKDTDYRPNYILMNLADINLMKLKKDANNNYVLPPFANLAGMEIDGITVVASSKVTADTMLMGDFDYATLYTEGSLDITMGYNNDDFTKNLVTVLAEERLALVVQTAETGAFAKETGIAAALVTLAS